MKMCIPFHMNMLETICIRDGGTPVAQMVQKNSILLWKWYQIVVWWNLVADTRHLNIQSYSIYLMRHMKQRKQHKNHIHARGPLWHTTNYIMNNWKKASSDCYSWICRECCECYFNFFRPTITVYCIECCDFLLSYTDTHMEHTILSEWGSKYTWNKFVRLRRTSFG